MTKGQILKKWIIQAETDYEASIDLLNKKKNLYVLFFCHQAVEKILKALYIKTINEQYPYVHDLTRLIKEVKLKNVPEDFLDLCEELNPFYIRSRYPSYKEDLFNKCTDEFTNSLQNRTGVFLEWSKQKLS